MAVKKEKTWINNNLSVFVYSST